MSACEKCWTDSRNGGDYVRLVRERDANPCTPEEQAGPAAKQCKVCKRMTLHQHSGEPMCGCPRDGAGHLAPRVTPPQGESRAD